MSSSGKSSADQFRRLRRGGRDEHPCHACVTNSVTNSQLKILFTPVLDNARASGIQVVKLADVFSDTDGIPDWWRLAYFGHALGQAGDMSRGGDDADGDGVSNYNEFLAGTDPLNAASVFKISQILVTGTNVQVSWPTTTNLIYQLQGTGSLNPPVSWANIGATTNATGGLATQMDFGGGRRMGRSIIVW